VNCWAMDSSQDAKRRACESAADAPEKARQPGLLAA